MKASQAKVKWISHDDADFETTAWAITMVEYDPCDCRCKDNVLGAVVSCAVIATWRVRGASLAEREDTKANFVHESGHHRGHDCLEVSYIKF